MSTYTHQFVFILRYALTCNLRTVKVASLQKMLIEAGFPVFDRDQVLEAAQKAYLRRLGDNKGIDKLMAPLKGLTAAQIVKKMGSWIQPRLVGCLMCGKPICSRFRTFCSEPCRQFYLYTFSWSHIQERVCIRDHFRCHDCGRQAVPRRYSTPEHPCTDPYCWFTRDGRPTTRDDPGRDHYERNPNYADQLDVHHNLPLHQGGTNEFVNLLTLCQPCHTIRHQREAQERRAARKAQAQEAPDRAQTTLVGI